jgi:hypothetical protein
MGLLGAGYTIQRAPPPGGRKKTRGFSSALDARERRQRATKIEPAARRMSLFFCNAAVHPLKS